LPLSIAYLGVILIWSTTPLAIKWSGEGAGILFGAASRMALGLAFCLVVVTTLGRVLPRHRPALLTYLAAGLGIWGAMSATYWSSQFIPSGLMSVLFGLTPVATGVLAALLLDERALTRSRLVGLGFAIGGLGLVFLPSLATAPADSESRQVLTLAAALSASNPIWSAMAIGLCLQRSVSRASVSRRLGKPSWRPAPWSQPFPTASSTSPYCSSSPSWRHRSGRRSAI
jgi:drug/metabolite transporter (DMT)-like permease